MAARALSLALISTTQPVLAENWGKDPGADCNKDRLAQCRTPDGHVYYYLDLNGALVTQRMGDTRAMVQQNIDPLYVPLCQYCPDYIQGIETTANDPALNLRVKDDSIDVDFAAWTVIFAHGIRSDGVAYDGWASWNSEGEGGATLGVNRGETVDFVVREILGALPNTAAAAATPEAIPAGSGLLGSGAIALAALAAAAALHVRRRRPRPNR
jgi:hypothetical protein